MVIYFTISLYNDLYALIATIVIAISKEVYDEIKYKGFDFIDILYTIMMPLGLYLKSLEI
jgi:hypothetical protein